MPHYRFFIDIPLQQQKECFLEGSEYHHMAKVMRLRVGDEIELVNGTGYLANATLVHLEKQHAVCLIKKALFEQPQKNPFIIAQAILKGSSLELIVEKNTELGAHSIWIFPAIYSEKKVVSEHPLERLRKHTLSALKQCGRLYLPEIRLFSSLTEVLKRPEIEVLYGDLSPSALPLSKTIRDPNKTTVFVVGPEQGFHETELTLLRDHGAQGVSLHKNILRAETASIAASACLSIS